MIDDGKPNGAQSKPRLPNESDRTLLQGIPEERQVLEPSGDVNMEIPAKNKAFSLVLKGLVALSAAVGVFLSALASKDAFMGGSRVFMYFTIQSNIVIAILLLLGAVFLLRRRKLPNAWYIVKFVGTVSITLTGVVLTFVLAPTLGRYAWNLQNVLTHVVVPVAAILDFFVTGPYGDIPKRDVLLVTLPPLAYAVYAGIGYAAGWEFAGGTRYPYFFLNWGSPAGAFGFTRELPFMGCVWWILALLLFLLAVGFVYLLILDRIKRRITVRR